MYGLSPERLLPRPMKDCSGLERSRLRRR